MSKAPPPHHCEWRKNNSKRNRFWNTQYTISLRLNIYSSRASNDIIVINNVKVSVVNDK